MIYINYKEIVMKSGRTHQLLLLLLHCTVGQELPDFSSYQDVHHHCIAHLHG